MKPTAGGYTFAVIRRGVSARSRASLDPLGARAYAQLTDECYDTLKLRLESARATVEGVAEARSTKPTRGYLGARSR